MNTDHSPLILAYLDGTISDEEMARLNAVLLESADARAQLRSWAAADVRLCELAADAAHAAVVRPGTRESPAGAGKSASWLDRVLLRGWRAPSAAGLAIGAAFTSVVWAYVAPLAAEAIADTTKWNVPTIPAPGDPGSFADACHPLPQRRHGDFAANNHDCDHRDCHPGVALHQQPRLDLHLGQAFADPRRRLLHRKGIAGADHRRCHSRAEPRPYQYSAQDNDNGSVVFHRLSPLRLKCLP